MEPSVQDKAAVPWPDRLRKSWPGAAAVVGAFSAFTAAFVRVRPETPAAASPMPAALLPVIPSRPASAPAANLPVAYSPAGEIAGRGSARPFRRSLSCIAVGAGGVVYALGDSEIRLYDGSGAFMNARGAPDWATCLSVAADGRVFVAGGTRIEIFGTSGRRDGGFEIDSAAGHKAAVTAIHAFQGEILAADAAARLILRYDFRGRRLGEIGGQNKTGSFMLPNRSLDFDVDSNGLVVAADSGRHRVTLWGMDGTPRGAFGRFGMRDPSDFVGCCNPVNIAWTPDGNVVTAEKMVARVKVYEPGGKLLAVVGPEYFDPQCTSIRLAVDSHGRILAADTVRREIRVFARDSKGAGR